MLRRSYHKIVHFFCLFLVCFGLMSTTQGCAVQRDASLKLLVEAMDSSKKVSLKACEEITKASLDCASIKFPDCKKDEFNQETCTEVQKLRDQCHEKEALKIEVCKMNVEASFSAYEKPVQTTKNINEAFELACSFTPLLPKEIKGLAERICQ